jgi:hypothetical protein
VSSNKADTVQIPRALFDRLVETLAFAASLQQSVYHMWRKSTSVSNIIREVISARVELPIANEASHFKAVHP